MRAKNEKVGIKLVSVAQQHRNKTILKVHVGSGYRFITSFSCLVKYLKLDSPANRLLKKPDWRPREGLNSVVGAARGSVEEGFRGGGDLARRLRCVRRGLWGTMSIRARFAGGGDGAALDSSKLKSSIAPSAIVYSSSDPLETYMISSSFGRGRLSESAERIGGLSSSEG